ncbi:hypothetical protein CWO91_17350 [Bradyrhizobium genosp. SA-3]|nr:hypothetical protein CWO91_17350 [Bradyrhizobium genosp. SA-3]
MVSRRLQILSDLCRPSDIRVQPFRSPYRSPRNTHHAQLADAAIETIGKISGETFAPLTRDEFRTLTEILKKIIQS